MVESIVEYEMIVDLLDDIFGEHRTHNEYTGQITYCCPVCSYEIKELDKPDGKFNFEVNYILGVGKCWSCCDTHNTHGRLSWLVKKHGTPKQFKRFEMLMPDEQGEMEKKTYKQVRLPKDYISFKDASLGIRLTHHYKRAYNYIKGRNVTDEMIERYKIGFCYQGEYANRIIIPSYDSDEILNYFIARSYESKTKFKYKNPEAQKEVIIFNEFLIDWDKPVYIVEGAFDSIFMPNSIPMLGKSMSELLFNMLYERAKEVIIVLDGDAHDNAEILYHKLNGGKLFNKIWLTKLPLDKDIADLCGDLTNHQPYQLK